MSEIHSDIAHIDSKDSLNEYLDSPPTRREMIRLLTILNSISSFHLLSNLDALQGNIDSSLENLMTAHSHHGELMNLINEMVERGDLQSRS